MKYLIFLLPVVVLLYLLHKVGNRSKLHKRIKLENLPDFIETFYFRGAHEATIVIDIMGRDVFVQFLKLLTDNDEIHIECFFPIVEWSRKFEPKLIDILCRDKYKFQKKKNDIYGFDEVIIEPGNNLESLQKFTKLILLDLFKLNSKERLSIIFSYICHGFDIRGKTEDVPSEKYRKFLIPISIPEYYGYKAGRFMKKIIDFFFAN